jgi:hypothetical protein
VQPPILELSTELRWLLLRAFAPVGLPFVEAVAGPRVYALARDLDLAARIAGRHPHEESVRALGRDAARGLQHLRLRVLALNQVLAKTTEFTVSVARRLGVELVLLKHAALVQCGAVVLGSRDARDVDVLLGDAEGRALHGELRRAGFRAGKAGHSAMHSPPLYRAEGEVIEIHHGLWGLRLPESNRSVTARALIERGHALPAGFAHVPSPALLAAHALVHGLVQHRTAPGDYPTLRLLADLCDLGEEALHNSTCTEFVSGEIASPALAAIRLLVKALREGADPRDLGEASPAYTLLSHLLAAALDPDYRDALFLDRRHALSAIRARIQSALWGEKVRGDQPELDGTTGTEIRRIATRIARGCAGYARLTLQRRRLRI